MSSFYLHSGARVCVSLLGRSVQAVVLGPSEFDGWLEVRVTDGDYPGAVVSVRERECRAA